MHTANSDLAKTGFANPDLTGLNDRTNIDWFSKPQAISEFFMIPYRFPLISAGIFGLTGVTLGALGAHELRDTLAQQGTQHAWETAAHYQLTHTLALLGAGLWLKSPTGAGHTLILWAARAWALGILFFSGSLYGLALGGPRILGPITPLGGIAFMAGWVLLIVAALKRESPPQN